MTAPKQGRMTVKNSTITRRTSERAHASHHLNASRSQRNCLAFWPNSAVRTNPSTTIRTHRRSATRTTQPLPPPTCAQFHPNGQARPLLEDGDVVIRGNRAIACIYPCAKVRYDALPACTTPELAGISALLEGLHAARRRGVPAGPAAGPISGASTYLSIVEAMMAAEAGRKAGARFGGATCRNMAYFAGERFERAADCCMGCPRVPDGRFHGPRCTTAPRTTKAG